MMLKVYVIFDTKAVAYLLPFFCPNRAVCMRQLATAASDPGHEFSRWGADYNVYEIGEWHQLEGKFAFYDAKENLGTVKEIIAMVDEVRQ